MRQVENAPIRRAACKLFKLLGRGDVFMVHVQTFLGKSTHKHAGRYLSVLCRSGCSLGQNKALWPVICRYSAIALLPAQLPYRFLGTYRENMASGAAADANKARL